MKSDSPSFENFNSISDDDEMPPEVPPLEDEYKSDSVSINILSY
jgi:hypothetical protein